MKELKSKETMYIINNRNCWIAYINLICKSNYRECSIEENKTYKTCISHCVNFKNTCGFDVKECTELNDQEFVDDINLDENNREKCK